MRRVVCAEFGGPEGLAVVEEATPDPGSGEVLVEVSAAGVSFVDGLIVAGRYQLRPPLPFTPGSAVAGRVAALGPDVAGPAVGTPVVAALMDFGGYASHVVVPAALAVPVPDGVALAVAASAMESY
ncbi:alcohol dehydrogenase catalytic domain-containing protein, partial [Pseudonocardia abyssalis]